MSLPSSSVRLTLLSLPVQGFGLYSHDVTDVQLAWTAYQHLQDLCSLPNSSSLFPSPITAQYSDEDSQSTELSNISNSSLILFVFETPHLPSLVRFTAICGISLSTNIRRYPLILKRWCAQLGAAYHELKQLSHILFITPSLEDAFIAEVRGTLFSLNFCSFPTSLVRMGPCS
jgi:hypothetical protein